MTRTYTTLLATAVGLLGLTANAHAFQVSADCNGWRVTTNFSDTPATLVATVGLEKLTSGVYGPTAGGSTQTQTLTAPGAFDISQPWTVTLATADGYRASFHLVITTPTNTLSGDYTVEFSGACQPPPPPSGGASRTPGFWKNHPEVWPVTTLSLGGDPYAKQCLLNFFAVPTVGDARVIMIHHLIAAKLNILPNTSGVAGNVSPSTPTGYPLPSSTIADTINAADDYLASSGTEIDCATNTLTGAAPRRGQKALVNAIKDALDDFNNLGE